MARGRFVLDHQPLVRRICRRFSHSGEPLEDILQVEVVASPWGSGLLKAIEKSDPDRGTEFKAFAVLGNAP